MTQHRNRELHWLLAVPAVVGLSLLTAGPAAAQAIFTADFEPGSPEGTLGILTGQNGWYIPTIGGNDYIVDTYAGNALGLPVNPTGGSQLIEAVALGNGTFARAQHDYAFGNGVYTVGYDFCCSNNTGHYKDNIGGWSLQDSSGFPYNVNYFGSLAIWLKRPVTGGGRTVKLSLGIIALDSDGDGMNFYRILAIGLPEKIFDKIKPDNWYRHTMTWDFGSNTIIATSMTDLTAGGSTFTVDLTQLPFTLYLAGGLHNFYKLPAPTAFGFYCGGGYGSIPGNIMAWDNVTVHPGPPAIAGKTIQATLVPVRKIVGRTK
jgi:hypothetical protein